MVKPRANEGSREPEGLSTEAKGVPMEPIATFNDIQNDPMGLATGHARFPDRKGGKAGGSDAAGSVHQADKGRRGPKGKPRSKSAHL